MTTDQTSKYCAICRQPRLHARPGTNHLLHLVITLFLCGFWLPVWILSMVKIGGWRCQTCGYKGSASSRLVAPVVVLLTIGLFVVSVCYWMQGGPKRKAAVMAAVGPNAHGEVESRSNARSEKTPDQASNQSSRSPQEGAPAASARPAATGPLRMWSDSTGAFRTEARYRGMTAGKVSLMKPDGAKVTIPFSHLSAADQRWVQEHEGQP